MSEPGPVESAKDLSGRRVVFVGKLGGTTRKEAFQLVRQHDGVPLESADPSADLIVVGADHLNWDAPEEFLDPDLRQHVAEGSCEVWSETQFWEALGQLDGDASSRRLYTPAMLAQLLEVSVTTVRRWHRLGLIMPVREVRRLPYFDFQEVASARRIAGWIAAGDSPLTVEKKLERIARFVADADRPLAQLNILVEGRDVLLRQGEGLIEPGGQLRIDFEALEPQTSQDAEPIALPITAALENRAATAEAPPTADELAQLAAELEDAGRDEEAIEVIRSQLMAFGPRAEVCFHLAELLYRQGNLPGACERYFNAVELDEDYVEARNNLGCVLAEMGSHDLAIAAFRGALDFHPDYPDAHFHLAQSLDETGHHDEAADSWARFLTLAPDSPWADQARRRLGREED